MHPAAQAVKFAFQRRKVDGEAAIKAEYLKKIASRRRLNLASMRTEKCRVVMRD